PGEARLILIDGVCGRRHVQLGALGLARERDARRGCTGSPGSVERVEFFGDLLPPAIMFGAAAAGGVVNIITERPTNDWHGSLFPVH
ncbi:hypothetical protein ACVXG7_11500, partial [Enterobacter hormaechei]